MCNFSEFDNFYILKVLIKIAESISLKALILVKQLFSSTSKFKSKILIINAQKISNYGDE